jgi:hypothetical protein
MLMPGDHYALLDCDKTADGEDDDAIGFRDCIAQGTGPGVVEVCDGVDGAAAATCCVCPEAFCTWEGESLDEGDDERNESKEMHFDFWKRF